MTLERGQLHPWSASKLVDSAGKLVIATECHKLMLNCSPEATKCHFKLQSDWQSQFCAFGKSSYISSSRCCRQPVNVVANAKIVQMKTAICIFASEQTIQLDSRPLSFEYFCRKRRLISALLTWMVNICPNSKIASCCAVSGASISMITNESVY